MPASYDVAAEEWRRTIWLRYVSVHVCQGWKAAGFQQTVYRVFAWEILHVAAWETSIHTRGSGRQRSQNTNTLLLLYPCISLHTLFLCCSALFPAPLAVTVAREGREERGRGGREGGRVGRERGPDHPALMAGLSVYICRGSLCNTSGILRPLSPARDVGV